MRRTCTRRHLLIGTCGAMAVACAPSSRPAPPVIPPGTMGSIADIEGRVGGRVGVFALDTGSGRMVAHRPDERFAMCSTFKWALAAAVLVRVDRAQLSLS